jgi:hypothetical protein
MTKIRLYGDTSGYVELDAPAAAGNNSLVLPTSAGTLDRLNRAGNVIQVVNYQTGAVATGTTTIPVDDTIPQNTEGTEFMTLAITPTNASNKLLIQAVGTFACDTASRQLTMALFQDSTANALTSAGNFEATAGATNTQVLTHYMTAGTTSSTTFKIRAGVQTSGTVTFNGAAAGRYYGGTYSSFIIITEIAA